MIFEEALMRCDMCHKQRPEPMLTLMSKEKKIESENVLIEVRHCVDITLCIQQAKDTIKEAFN